MNNMVAWEVMTVILVILVIVLIIFVVTLNYKIFCLESISEKHKEYINVINKTVESLKIEAKKLTEYKLTKDQKEYKEQLNAKFEALLQEAYDKACEQIKFDEIEYKKTITKKRQEFSRKNSKHAKPEREWRYIDED